MSKKTIPAIAVLAIGSLLLFQQSLPAQNFRSFRSSSRRPVVVAQDYASQPVQPSPNPAPTTIPVTAPASDVATLKVVLPLPDAELWVEGARTMQTGMTRTFESPPLIAGIDYAYHLRARWVEGGHAVELWRTVPVGAGQQVLVDFTAAGAATSAHR